ncbi:SPC12-domain-containing protein [Martensiomyces pterosporus]|nr:SPC12-domain-containing protein [Martensiomyces pterosporus]
MDFLRPVFESGRIDFEGQKLASNLSNALIVSSGIVSLVVGLALERLSLCFYTYLFGVVLTYVVVLLPWPYFKRSPVVWLSRKAQVPIDSPSESRKTLIEDVSDDGDDDITGTSHAS